MAKRVIGKLKVKQITAAKPGRLGDGGGLWLDVRPSGSRAWEFRFSLAGKPQTMGLGSAVDVSLEEARDAAYKCRKLVREGKDPRRERDAQRRAMKKGPTFRSVMEAYIESKKNGWSRGYVKQSESKFERLVYPRMVEGSQLQDLPVNEVDTTAVLAVLQPIWETHTVSAGIIRQWIEAGLDFAKVKGYRTGENPARWRGHLAVVLPKPGDIHEPESYAALSYADAPAFLTNVRAVKGIGSPPLEWAIYAPVRVSTIITAEWAEFHPVEGPDGDVEFPSRTWSIPQAKMKNRKKVRFPKKKYDVPLTEAMIDILKRMWRERTGRYVFPGEAPDTHVSVNTVYRLAKLLTGNYITVHGFRAMYRTWADDRTNCENEVKKMALGHSIGNKTEEAYARSDFIEKRRILQEVWTDYLVTGNDVAVDIIAHWIERHNRGMILALAAE